MELVRGADWRRLATPTGYAIWRDCLYETGCGAYLHRLRTLAAEPEVSFLLCRMDGALVGVLALRQLPGARAEVAALAVGVRFRRQGVGRFLLRAALDGQRSLCAQTDGDAVGFYRRCGCRIEKLPRDNPALAQRYRCTLEAV